MVPSLFDTTMDILRKISGLLSLFHWDEDFDRAVSEIDSTIELLQALKQEVTARQKY